LREKFICYIFFATGIVDIIISIINFTNNKASTGATYLALAVVFIVLGFRYKKRYNK
jgi:uncharacterized membrane protein HdeD (DUF308 family)